MQQHTYSIASDFPNGFDSSRLKYSIQESAISASLDRIDTNEDVVDIFFRADASKEEVDALVAAHDGKPLIPPPAPVSLFSGNEEVRSYEGKLIMAPTWETTDGLSPEFRGHLYKASAGATSFFDEKISTQIRLRGGWYEILQPEQASLGDYVEFSIMDKDDVLGLFSGYGLTAGQPGHVLELKKYVKKDYVNPASAGKREEFRVGGGFNVIAGLYFRTSYVSVGSKDVDLKTVVLSYE